MASNNFEELEPSSSARVESLDALRIKSDVLLERMQTTAFKKALDAAFYASPEDLGRAAVQHALNRK